MSVRLGYDKTPLALDARRRLGRDEDETVRRILAKLDAGDRLSDSELEVVRARLGEGAEDNESGPIDPKLYQPEIEEEAGANDFAMDAAPSSARGHGGFRRALRRVEPVVGEILAADSAEDVFREGLRRLGVASGRTVHRDALPEMFRQAVRGRRAGGGSMLVHSAPIGASDGFTKRFPAASRIRSV